jgi:hypothetical protein
VARRRRAPREREPVDHDLTLGPFFLGFVGRLRTRLAPSRELLLEVFEGALELDLTAVDLDAAKGEPGRKRGSDLGERGGDARLAHRRHAHVLQRDREKTRPHRSDRDVEVLRLGGLARLGPRDRGRSEQADDPEREDDPERDGQRATGRTELHGGESITLGGSGSNFSAGLAGAALVHPKETGAPPVASGTPVTRRKD